MKKNVAIIGSGPAALLCAAFLDIEKFNITIFEKNKSIARKFLVAGNGGFNLTHSEDGKEFIQKYLPQDYLDAAFASFTNTNLIFFLETIGIKTIIGSSGKIYPEKDIKPIQVIQAIKKYILKKEIHIALQQKWLGWTENEELSFENNPNVKTDYTIFALGGKSWEITGSDGLWTENFEGKSINCLPFLASNCACKVNFETEFILKHEGHALKNIELRCGKKTQKGELIITKFGLEGNAIYGLSNSIRKELLEKKVANISIDFKPSLSTEKIVEKLKRNPSVSISNVLKKELNLSPTQIQLLKSVVNKETFLNIEKLAISIKNVPLEISELGPISEAISTVGGIDCSELNPFFELKKLENTFCIGEMVNWDAPTGGYLLQACFSMGVHVAKHLNDRYKSYLE